MIFEDLGPKGFKNANKVNGLDYKHMEIALKKLAIWHAVTAVMILDVKFSNNLLFFVKLTISHFV